MDVDVIIQGDALEEMRAFPAECIDLTVTSPPYDNLREYHGYTFDFESIAKELFRVTKPGGAVVWVVGDATIDGSETGTSFRQALYFKEIGFNLHDTMIYKKDGISFPDKNRYQSCFEYMFVFSKDTPKTINLICDHKNVSHGRKVSGTERESDGTTRAASCIGQKINRYGTRWNIWEIPAIKGNHDINHPAIFPEQLASDHILSWSNPGDLILDPMCGSGTTCKMAKYHGRHYLGIDISSKYCDIARRRIAAIPARLDRWSTP